MQDPQAAVAAVAGDDVVQDRDAKDLAGGEQALGERQVLRGGLRVAGGVVVGEDHRGRVRQ